LFHFNFIVALLLFLAGGDQRQRLHYKETWPAEEDTGCEFVADYNLNFHSFLHREHFSSVLNFR